MLRFCYSLLLYVLQPLIGLRLWWRGRRAPAYRRRWTERYALYRTPVSQHGIILHSVSVGETLAAVPLVRALQQRYPQLPITVTTMTPTGSERARAAFGDSVQHLYLPYDLPDAMRRFYRHLQPKLVVVMETELWPNMIWHAHRRGIPLVIANARLSARSARGYGKIRRFMAQLLPRIAHIAAQTPADGERFIALGLPAAQLTVTGSIKFDISVTAEQQNAASTLRAQWAAQRPVWIAASTHDGEESAILQAHQALLAAFPDLLLILVPRHPERFAAVHELVSKYQLSSVTRSSQAPVTATTQVVVGDTMGEMMVLYGVADLAFVGGSLIERGGHNPLEPAAYGLPVLMGPHTFNFAQICQQLEEAGGLTRVSDARSLQQAVTERLQQPELAARQGKQALTFMQQNQGALSRLLTLLDTALSGSEK